MLVDMRVLAVCGSLQSKSSNLSLLETARRVAPAGMEVTLDQDLLRRLPHFDPDLERDGAAPEPVRAWRAQIAQSNALLIACPEYGFSLPGALKNGIDWVIGSGELERKLTAVTASTVHPQRGRLGLQALLQTLSAVSAEVVGGEPTVRGDGEEAAVRALLAALEARMQGAAGRF